MLESFLFPGILAAGAAAAAPVAIHLIMRNRPRRVVFPALRFVRKTHQAHVSMYRLKHLLLLGMRMAAIALLAVLLARLVLRGTKLLPDSTPVDAVIILDNSASMGYVHGNRTRLKHGKAMAARIVEALPGGSRVAVLNTSAPATTAKFLSDRRLVLQQIWDVPPTAGAATASTALSRAVSLPAGAAREARREVFLISDLTRHSLAEPLGVKDAADVQFTLLDAGAGEDANVALSDVRLGATAVSAGTPVTVEATIHAASVSGEATVTVELAGTPEASRTVSFSPSHPATVSLAVRTPRPEKAGSMTRRVVAGRIVLGTADPLAADNVRYFTIALAPPARMLVVTDTNGEGLTGLQVLLAVAPPGAKDNWLEAVPLKSDQLTAERLAGSRIVLLANVSRLSVVQWQALERHVTTGGALWVVAGSLMNPADYNAPAAQRLMPATVGALAELPSPTTWQPPKTPHPMLTGGSMPVDVTGFRFYRRLAMGPKTMLGPNSEVLARYADDVPAILRRRVGQGAVLLWNFSPRRELSNLAQRGQYVVLARRAAEVLGELAGQESSYLWGRSVTVRVPRAMGSPGALLLRPGGAGGEPLLPPPGKRSLVVVAGQVGNYKVTFTEAGDVIERGFSVNADPAESDLSTMDPAELAERFPADRLTVTADPDAVANRRQAVGARVDLTFPLLLAVVALLTGESFFANRFYRRSAETPGESAPPKR